MEIKKDDCNFEHSNPDNVCYHELFHYNENLELKKNTDVEGSNKLQVHAKMLDFDWVFVNNNSTYLI